MKKGSGSYGGGNISLDESEHYFSTYMSPRGMSTTTPSSLPFFHPFAAANSSSSEYSHGNGHGHGHSHNHGHSHSHQGRHVDEDVDDEATDFIQRRHKRLELAKFYSMAP